MDERTLAGAGDAGDDDENPERDVNVDVLQVVLRGSADLQGAGGGPHALLQSSAVVEVTASERAARSQPLHCALKGDVAACRAGAGPEIDDVIGDGDRVRFVLDDKHGVAFVPQPQQQVVHPLDVMRMQAHGGFVEDIGHIGEGRSEVTDHLGALRLASRQRPGRPVQAEVAEPDFHERVKGLPK